MEICAGNQLAECDRTEKIERARQNLRAAGSNQVLPPRLAHFEAIAVGQQNPAFFAPFAQNLAHTANVHNGRAMDANKPPGIERFRELFDGFAQHQALCADVQAGVVVGSLDPFDLFDIDKGVFCPVRDNEALRIFTPRRVAVVECGQRGFQLFLRQEGGLRSDLLFHAPQRSLQALGLDRLGEVVERIYIESFHRIVIVRGDKHHDRHVRHAYLLDNVEPACARHLDIEEQQIVAILFERRDRFVAIAAFPGDSDIVARQQKPEPLARQWLIVGNKCSQRHSASFVGNGNRNLETARFERSRLHIVRFVVEMGEPFARVLQANAIARFCTAVDPLPAVAHFKP